MSALLEKLPGVANAPGLRPQAAEKRHDLKISVCQAPGSGIMPGPGNLSMELIAFLWLNFRT